MSDKLGKMVELSKLLKVGQTIPYRNMQAKVEAFNDCHLFLSVPEIAVEPEDVDGVAENVRVRDREVENLKREVASLRNEIDRLLHDASYRSRQAERVEYERRMKEDMWRYERELMRRMPAMKMDPRVQSYEAPYFDAAMFKKPSQQK